ncbi:hypothetical protein SUGI_0300850 [Cryptomeria japonica]|uniref:uncharacterized protein LOC131074910 n=1 Tax=Cryptomeria japonica TaxID=3369 RepID=UPI002408CAE3|nr:uncharacterized protein LOC131074910 [Cryptomeria japonica]GLJ17326.1 hypothetical protein SUGI_0300850 [Cryptomeria japonica]
MMSPCSAPNQEEIVPAEPTASANQAIPPHPLQQIAESANHKLLLKQWLKEEESIDRRVALKESRLDRTRKEVTQLCCFYFLFHGTVLTLLFNAAARNPKDSCKRAWIPSMVSLVASMVIIWAVRYKIDVETQIERLLKREKDDAKLMAKCIQELKRKGTGFDLLKEVDTLRRAKSLRVEPKAVMKWSGRDLVTIFFIAMSCLILAFTKVVLCD